MKTLKEYRYKGYTIRRTDAICGNNGRYLYDIDDLKAYGIRPFITSLADCREFINDHIESQASRS